MCHIGGLPLLQPLETPAEVLADLAVDEFDLTSRCQRHDQAGNAVDDQARLAFALAERVRGALLVVDVDDDAVPLRDSTVRITERLSDRLNPAQLTVRPSQLVGILIRGPRPDRLQPALYRRIAVIGMDELEPSAIRKALRRVAEKVHGPLVQVIQVALGSTAPDQRRNGIDKQAKLTLAS